MPVTAPLPQHIYRFDERIQECINVHKFCKDMLFSTILYNIKLNIIAGSQHNVTLIHMHHVENQVRFCLSQSQTSGAPLRETSFRYQE